MSTPVKPDYWQHDLVRAGAQGAQHAEPPAPHPATHGIFQNVLTMDGEYIQSAEAGPSVTSTRVREMAGAPAVLPDRRPYRPPRTNYCSAPINNMAWHMTVEKLVGIETPKRVDYLRVMRDGAVPHRDHLICNSVIDCGYRRAHRFHVHLPGPRGSSTRSSRRCGARPTTNMGRGRVRHNQ